MYSVKTLVSTCNSRNYHVDFLVVYNRICHIDDFVRISMPNIKNSIYLKYLFLSYDAEQWYSSHNCEIHETKLNPAEVQSLWFLSRIKILIMSPQAGLETWGD